jgi:hypothetical protein
MSEHSHDGPDEVDREQETSSDPTAPDTAESAADPSSESAVATSDGVRPDDETDTRLPDEVGVARQRLAGIADLPVEEHAAVYEDVHRRLQDALADVEIDADAGDDGASGR